MYWKDWGWKSSHENMSGPITVLSKSLLLLDLNYLIQQMGVDTGEDF